MPRETDKTAMNPGKRFENNFRDSVPNEVLYHRLKDSAQSFGGTNKLRFSSKNPCDCFLFCSPLLFALEMKSVASSSISFERAKNEKTKKMVHFHQIKGLRDFNRYNNMVAGFIFNFRHGDGNETCYFQHISDFDRMIGDINKKSFNEKDLLRYNPLIIKNEKKNVNYRYDVSKFIGDVIKRYKTEREAMING